MAQTRKDLRGRVLRKGESQRRSDGRYVYRGMYILIRILLEDVNMFMHKIL